MSGPGAAGARTVVGEGERARPAPRTAAAFVTAVCAAGLVFWAARSDGKWMEFQLLNDSMIQLHAASAHFPIGLLLSSAALDLAAAVTRRADLRAAGFWTLILGALGALASVILGYLGNPFAGDTGELAAKVLAHQRAGVVTVAVVGVLALWRVLRVERFERFRGAEAVAYGLLTLAGAAAVAVTGYLGGHLLE
jgi:uncharacterized membrane protein